MKTYVIAGGSAAGVAAARAIRANDSSARILMFCGDPSFYTRCQLHKVAAGEKGPMQIPFVPSDFAASIRLEVVRGCLVEGVDVKSQRVALAFGDHIPYDKLLVATGSSATLPPLDGFVGAGVFKFRDIFDALAIRDAIQGGAMRVAVVGAGLAGAELAAELALKGVDVSLVERESRPLPLQLEDESGAICTDLLTRAGIKLRCGEKVLGLSRDSSGQPVRLEMESGLPVRCEIVICAAGVRPNTSLLNGSGVKINRGIVIDSKCGTNIENVFAAGDVTESPDLISGLPGPTAIWPAAVRQGVVAGANMAGVSSEVERITGFRTAFSLAGASFVSLGQVSKPDPSWKKIVFRSKDQNGRKTMKVFFLDGELLRGSVICGDISSSGVYADAIINKRPLPFGEDGVRELDSLEASRLGKGPLSI